MHTEIVKTGQALLKPVFVEDAPSSRWLWNFFFTSRRHLLAFATQ